MATVPQRMIRPIAGAANRPTPVRAVSRVAATVPRPTPAVAGVRRRKDRIQGLVISAAIHLLIGLVLAIWTLSPVVEDLPLNLAGGLVEGAQPVALDTASPVLTMPSRPAASLSGSEAETSRELVLSSDSGNPIAAGPVTSDSGPAAAFETAREGEVAFFGANSAARSFVFVVDLSGSMQTNRRFDRLVNELSATIQTLEASQQFSVVFFNDHPLPLFSPRPSQGLIAATKVNKQRAIRWIRSRRPDGLTNPDLALEMALAMRPGAVYFLTDGEIVGGEVLTERLARWNTAGVPIHTLAFESREGEETLTRIAQQSGGTYRFVE
jgi:hypothetical protein